jgi:ATP-dependent Clp protease adaptor protein ClpS
VSLERNRAAAEENELAVLPRREVRQPRRFAVVLHNDDYTTMEFVVMVLTRYFAKSETEASRIMLEVHSHGRGVAGIFSRDVAESKVEQVEEAARTEGHPLRCTAEPFDAPPNFPPGQ